jgi:hypothetical protein
MKTTLHTVLCVAVRMGAVLMAVGIIEQVPTIFLYPSQGGSIQVGSLLMSGAGLLAAFALWLWPNILAWWAISRSQSEILESPISPDQLQRVALSVVGIWLFISGLSGTIARVAIILVVYRRSAYGESLVTVSNMDWYWLGEHLVTLLAGASLALGAAGLVGLLHRIRGYARIADVQNDPDANIAKDG